MKLKNRAIEDAILLLIIGQVVVFRFFNIHETMNKVILAMILLLVLINNIRAPKITLQKHRCENFGTIAALVLFLLNGIFFGVNDLYLSNFLMMLYPIMNMAYLTWYIRRDPRNFFLRMLKIKGLINIYFLVNIIVLLIQMQGNYFMVGFTTWENTLYHDLISGLFGYSMTHAVCYFSVFLSVYNMVVMRTIRSNLSRKMFAAYNVILVLVICFISLYNDNVQYFVILPFVLMIFKFTQYRLNTISGAQKAFVFFLAAVFVLAFLISIIPGAYELLEENILYKITGSFKHMHEGAAVKHGSMERLALLVYGLVNAHGLILGDGFSYSGLYTPNTYGFAHFGNASIGAIVCLGGIWFFIAIIMIYSTKMISIIVPHLEKKQKSPYKIMIPAFFVIVSLLTQPMTDVSISLCIIFIMLALGLDKFLDGIYGRSE